MSEIFTQVFILGLLATAVRSAAPLILAALGESFSQRAGVINVGLGGYMLFGAFGGYLTSYYTASPWLAAVAGSLAGGALALLAAFVMISRRADQIVTGLAVWILAVGTVGVVYRLVFRSSSGLEPERVSVDKFDAWSIPGLSNIPWAGEVLFSQVSLVYIALLAVPLAWLLQRSRSGLKIRAVGEHPEALESAGGNVIRIRYLCVVGTGLLAGLGGVYLSIGQTDTFDEGLIGGRGFIAIGIAIVGRRNPFGVLFAAFLFAITDSLQLWLPTAGVDIPQQLLAMLPYVVTIIALVGVLGRVRHPRAFLKPYVRQT